MRCRTPWRAGGAAGSGCAGRRLITALLAASDEDPRPSVTVSLPQSRSGVGHRPVVNYARGGRGALIMCGKERHAWMACGMRTPWPCLERPRTGGPSLCPRPQMELGVAPSTHRPSTDLQSVLPDAAGLRPFFSCTKLTPFLTSFTCPHVRTTHCNSYLRCVCPPAPFSSAARQKHRVQSDTLTLSLLSL